MTDEHISDWEERLSFYRAEDPNPEWESIIQKTIISMVKRWGWFHMKMNPGLAGVPKGFPDLMVFVPGGRPCFIEVKRPYNDPMPMQRVWNDRLKKMGYEAFIIDNSDHAFFTLKGLYERAREHRERT